MKKVKIADWIGVSVFLALIFGLAVLNTVKADKEFSESENRFLAQRPKLSIVAIFDGSFEKDTEKYITDQFIGRDGFISVKTQSEHALQKQESNGIYFGKDGYLLEKQELDSEEEALLNKNLERIGNLINAQSAKLGEGRAVAMLVPTSAAILKDKLPPFAFNYNQLKAFDTVYNAIPQGAYIDVAAVLDEHDDEYIYYKTDHHWTTDGAFYAYQAYCDYVGLEGISYNDFEIKSVTDDFYGTIYSKANLLQTKPDKIYRYTPNMPLSYTVDYNMGQKTSDSLYEEEFLLKRDKYSYFLGGNNAVVKITSSNKNGKTLLVLKDSFAHSIAPFLANEYENVIMLDLRYYNGKVSEFITQNAVTDLLVLYNFATLYTDKTITQIDK